VRTLHTQKKPFAIDMDCDKKRQAWMKMQTLNQEKGVLKLLDHMTRLHREALAIFQPTAR
jgi:hypothetical protein